MALVKYGAGIDQYAGGVGGGIFYNDRCLHHLISKPRGCNKGPSLAQLAVREAFRKCVNFWRAYSEAEPFTFVIHWHNWATTHTHTNAKGEVIYLNSYNWFIKFNMPRILVGLDAMFSPLF